jgi:pyruvate formate lyase activating enzyme
MREARLYSTRPDGSVDCHLCAFRCHIADGRHGVCGVRENMAGTLYTNVYGKVIAQHVDPIEKKPLFQFLPGTSSYSVATVGCNFRCLHCQNSEISQMPKEQKRIIGEDMDPRDVLSYAQDLGCASIAYTYTEPTIFFEYAYDIGVLAKEAGIKNVFVTNGYMTKECLDELDGVLDAANVDIKAFNENFYKKICGARLAPVLESVEYMRSLGIWVEVTTLIIPTYNDTEDELRSIAKWIYKTDKSMPWHLSAFHPYYKLQDVPPTPVETIERAREIGLEEGLRYVYSGNIPGMKGESTYCYNCKKLLIERVGFTIKKNLMEDARCPYCKVEIDGCFAN